MKEDITYVGLDAHMETIQAAILLPGSQSTRCKFPVPDCSVWIVVRRSSRDPRLRMLIRSGSSRPLMLRGIGGGDLNEDSQGDVPDRSCMHGGR
jgi:hypothetical protein